MGRCVPITYYVGRTHYHCDHGMFLYFSMHGLCLLVLFKHVIQLICLELQGVVYVGGVGEVFKVNDDWGRLKVFEYVHFLKLKTSQGIATHKNIYLLQNTFR